MFHNMRLSPVAARMSLLFPIEMAQRTAAPDLEKIAKPH